MTGSPYSDLTRPPLREQDLRRALVTPGGVWTDVRVLAVTESTNADVASAAQAGAPDGLVVIAENQTAGRGRLGRRWEAPPRSALTFSVLLRPGVPAARLGWITLLAGVAVAESVGRVAVVDAVLKWPNDLLVRSALAGDVEQVEHSSSQASIKRPDPVGGQGAEYGKCGGILAEALPDERVVVGIGLNVSQRADELPPVPAPAFPPTSLALAGAAMTDRDPLLRAMLRALADWFERWHAAGGDPDASGVRAAYRERCLTIGSGVTVSLPGGDHVVGTAKDIDEEGRLVVIGLAGVRALAAGDVYHVR